VGIRTNNHRPGRERMFGSKKTILVIGLALLVVLMSMLVVRLRLDLDHDDPQHLRPRPRQPPRPRPAWLGRDHDQHGCRDHDQHGQQAFACRLINQTRTAESWPGSGRTSSSRRPRRSAGRFDDADANGDIDKLVGFVDNAVAQKVDAIVAGFWDLTRTADRPRARPSWRHSRLRR